MHRIVDRRDKEQLPDKLLLYFDGACEPRNPGGWATYGWCIWSTDSLTEYACGCGVAASSGHHNATNNYAEYCALGFALRWLLDQGWKGDLKIKGDSMLVISQLTRQWKCNKDHLRKLRQRCWDILVQLGTYKAEWVPREQNTRCDQLSQEAYVEATGKPFPQRRRDSFDPIA